MAASEFSRYESVPVVKLDARVRRYRGNIMVSGAQSEDVLELSEAAERIWLWIDGGRSIREIGRMLADEYEVAEEEACADTAELVEEFVEAGVVDLHTP
ncbi:PqqD family protein [Actinacidiphila glaucinigra]|uniref:PqqD family protein n=1 Tax=Actinacidiphila glaucinigra TaxID=235986 RepID=UPI002DD7DF6B|nr:PqqD family protein [Actinacidiphila glaucinigra]WSD65069.1 PqqD family protein [Actinacidiphila glaucinigra]